MDALTAEYAGQPALFLEQSVDFPVGNRYNRWWAAFSGTSTYLPLVMVDSGHKISSGSKPDFKAAYRPLINAELARAPGAEIEAFARQVGSKVRVYAKLRNTSGVTLSSANSAALHAVVWEEKHVAETDNYVRAAPWTAITEALASGAEATFTLETGNLSGVGWNAIRAVVLADYVPGPGTAYDMLQAAVAEPAALSADPQTTTVRIDAGHPEDVRVPLTLRGPYVLTWTATPDVPWITVSADSGPISAPPTLTVVASALSPGWQEGHVTIAAASEDGMSFAQTLTVRAFLGSRMVRAASVTATPGQAVSVPVEFSALGNEGSVSFTLSWGATPLTLVGLSYGGVVNRDTLTTDGSEADQGRLGVTVTLPFGQTFGQGDLQLLQLVFAPAPAGAGGTFSVGFDDTPVPRQVTVGGTPVSATFVDGAVIVPGNAARPPRRHLGR